MILARKLMCLRLLKDDGVNWNKNRNQGYNLRRAPCAQMLIAVFVQAFLRIYLYTNYVCAKGYEPEQRDI